LRPARRGVGSAGWEIPVWAEVGLAVAAAEQEGEPLQVLAQHRVARAISAWPFDVSDVHRSRKEAVPASPHSPDAQGQVRRGLSNEIELMPLALKLMCATSWKVSIEPSLPFRWSLVVVVAVPFWRLPLSPSHSVKWPE